MEITLVPAGSSGQNVASSEAVREDSAAAATPAASSFELPRPAYRLSGPTLAGIAALAGVGAVALGSLAFFTTVRAEDRTGAPVAGELEPVVSLLSRPSTTRVAMTGPVGRMILALGPGGSAYLVRHRLEPLPATKAYQAWVVGPRSKRARPAAVFSSSDRAVALDGALAPGSLVTVTVEPAGGSEAPTRRPVLQGRLPG